MDRDAMKTGPSGSGRQIDAASTVAPVTEIAASTATEGCGCALSRQWDRAGSAGDRVAMIGRTASSPGAGASSLMVRLQRQYGNQYVGRLIARAEAEGHDDGSSLDHVERSIDSARGSGNALDGRTLDRMNTAFGADFSGVRVHTGGQADSLNRAVEAKAFATGKDIFFREGAYNPGSSEGRGLLAHELTHVVQQTGNGLQMKLAVSNPDDAQELEAERVSREVMQDEHEREQSAA